MIGRRTFIQDLSLGGAALLLGKGVLKAASAPPPLQISLAQWSLHRAIFAGEINAMEFASVSRERFQIEAIEYVNQFYREIVKQPESVRELRRRADDQGVKSLLIMVDGEGQIGASEESERKAVVENHRKWMEMAAVLGCHSIRVNAGGPGDRGALRPRAVEGLRGLCEAAQPFGLNVIVENHGGWSSDGAWLAAVIEEVGLSNCGTLPDFGNFCIRREESAQGRICVEAYDRYRGVTELMPRARAVSAKSYAFDDAGNETTIDYGRMLKIVREAGYSGYIGIEFEGKTLSEEAGILQTKALLTRHIHSNSP
jgi:sugar phosphate isomerase/epimerase